MRTWESGCEVLLWLSWELNTVFVVTFATTLTVLSPPQTVQTFYTAGAVDSSFSFHHHPATQSSRPVQLSINFLLSFPQSHFTIYYILSTHKSRPPPCRITLSISLTSAATLALMRSRKMTLSSSTDLKLPWTGISSMLRTMSTSPRIIRLEPVY